MVIVQSIDSLEYILVLVVYVLSPLKSTRFVRRSSGAFTCSLGCCSAHNRAKHDTERKFLTSSNVFSSVRETSASMRPLDHARADLPEVHRPPQGKHSQKLQKSPVSHA